MSLVVGIDRFWPSIAAVQEVAGRYRSPRILAQSCGDGWKASDVDAVLGCFGDEGKWLGAFAHARQGPKQRRARAAAAMRDDGRRRIPQYCREGRDIGARQRCSRDRDVMIGNAVCFGNAPGLGRRELSEVFPVGPVVDDCPYTRSGECIDVGQIETAGDAQFRSERKKLRCHAEPPRLTARTLAAAKAGVS